MTSKRKRANRWEVQPIVYKILQQHVFFYWKVHEYAFAFKFGYVNRWSMCHPSATVRTTWLEWIYHRGLHARKFRLAVNTFDYRHHHHRHWLNTWDEEEKPFVMRAVFLTKSIYLSKVTRRQSSFIVMIACSWISSILIENNKFNRRTDETSGQKMMMQDDHPLIHRPMPLNLTLTAMGIVHTYEYKHLDYERCECQGCLIKWEEKRSITDKKNEDWQVMRPKVGDLDARFIGFVTLNGGQLTEGCHQIVIYHHFFFKRSVDYLTWSIRNRWFLPSHSVFQAWQDKTCIYVSYGE